MSPTSAPNKTDRSVITVREGVDCLSSSEVDRFLTAHGHAAMYCNPTFVGAIAQGLQQPMHVVEARSTTGELVGLLPLVSLRSRLFGTFLVSIPYVSWAGPIAKDVDVALELVNTAIELTRELDAKFLELRALEPLSHPNLITGETNKVQMRLPLSRDAEANWRLLKSEVRTQVRKAMKQDLVVEWGGEELLRDFYDVFVRNMRDLGTPAFSINLFKNVLSANPTRAEIGVVRHTGVPIAACLTIHGPGLTEVPSAAALREFRFTAANSLLYWNAIERSIARGQQVFDFGRSTPGSPTFVFKRKWGAEPRRVVWQYHLRKGTTQDMRPDNKRFRLGIRIWQRLPVATTRVLGPMIVRGIP